MVNFKSVLISLAALAVGVAAVSPIQPPTVHERSVDEQRRDVHEPITNAKRMAQGLPPLPPNRRRFLETRTGVQPPTTSATPGQTLTGKIQVTNTNTGEFLGYIGKNFALYGEYGLVQKAKQALKVKVVGVSNGLSGPLQIKTTNGEGQWSNFGAVSGYLNNNNSLTAGSPGYVYLSATKQTAPGATPQVGGSAFYDATNVQKPVESAVWYFRTSTRRITFGWVNPDGSVASSAKLAFYKPDAVLVAVGDIAAFRAAYGATNPVTFTLVAE